MNNQWMSPDFTLALGAAAGFVIGAGLIALAWIAWWAHEKRMEIKGCPNCNQEEK